MTSGERTQTWFFHRGVYAEALDRAPEDMAQLVARCPLCDAGYVSVADADLLADAAYRRGAVEAAQAALATECPDHPHRFAVGR